MKNKAEMIMITVTDLSRKIYIYTTKSLTEDDHLFILKI